MRSKRGCIVARYNSQTHETTATCTNWSHAYVVNMGRLTIHERLRVITLFSRGHSVSSIRERLAEENVSISLKGLYNLLKKYREKQIIVDLPHQRRRRIIGTLLYARVPLFRSVHV